MIKNYYEPDSFMLDFIAGHRDVNLCPIRNEKAHDRNVGAQQLRFGIDPLFRVLAG